jgi:UDP-glucose:(heptosyl)LPS alpha-1,3-glucosyltransferase
MRIALLARRFDPSGGGTEKDLIVSAEILRRADHQVTIYADEVRGKVPGWSVIGSRTPAVGRTARLMIFSLTAALRARREGADLVLSFARTPGADILRSGGSAHQTYLRSAQLWRGPLMAAVMRLSPYHRIQIMLERRAFKNPSMRLAIAVSEMVRRDLMITFGLDRLSTETLYNGVDLVRFRPASTELRYDVRKELGVSHTARVAIFAGNGFARKGLGPLLEAWQELERDDFLLVVGNDRSISSYRRQCRQMGIAGRVMFTGPRNDIERIFAAADYLALPSLFEPFGNVIVEAMASGLPVLTSSRVGASELLPDSMKTFIVEDPTSAGQIAEKARILANRASRLSAEARHAAEACTWEAYGRRLLSLIEGAFGRSRATLR